MKVDGQCHCGAIAWEAEIDPDKILICHCTDCQVLSGGAFRWGTLIAREAFTLLRGEPRSYRKIADSGAARDLTFCGDCGTPLYGTQAEHSTTLSLRLGGARQANKLRPSGQIWTQSKLDWLGDIADMPCIDQPSRPVTRRI